MKEAPPTPGRRHWLSRVLALTAVATGAQAANNPAAPMGRPAPANDIPHKIVFQLNQADEAHREAIFNSISALLKKYVDDVAIAVVAWGPGIHILAKKPQRPVSELHQQRARSMAESYGVTFIACGNTMHSIGWTPEDMVDYAQIEEVGAAAVMELQEKGYAYLAW